MSPMQVIVLDTWRQSRQQVVFIIMLGLMLLVSLAFGVLLGPTHADQGRLRATIAFQDRPAEVREQGWAEASGG